MATRRARVPALAKINLGLRVLAPRPDGFHELRTVFQTISLADTLDIAFTPGRRTSVEATANIEIPGENIVARAARAALDAMRTAGRVEIHIQKRIPLGAGLGGGSSDGAAVLLALPALVGRKLDATRRMELGAALGSDVPFFLLGGTAVALGRGTELYPLEERRAAYALVISPGIHVSTAGAYRDLDAARRLTSDALQNMISSFGSFVWEQAGCSSAGCGNDFEAVVFRAHPRLSALKRRLEKLGASPALLSGSGSALYGVFGSRDQAQTAAKSLEKELVFPVRFVSRRAYRALWWRSLGGHITERVWPPQSQYA